MNDDPSLHPLACAIGLLPMVLASINEHVMPLATAVDPTDSGGWFTAWHASPIVKVGHEPVFGIRVGIITGSTPLRELMRVASEKAERLSRHPEHVSSWQTRDVGHPNPMKRQYGGAIRVGHGLIFSFSGFAELYDEMAMLLAARRLGLLNDTEIEQIIAVSDNIPYRDFMTAVRRDT